MKSFALLVLVSIAGCRDHTPPPAHAPAPDAGPPTVELTPQGLVNAEIRTTPLLPQSFSPRLKVTATISGDPKGVARIGSRVPGRVARIDVALGDQVKKGQPLVELDAVEAHKVSLELATARARRRAADDTLARQRQLVAERVGAEQELRRAESEAAAAAAEFREAEEHLRFLGLSPGDIARAGTEGERAARSVIRAPIDGQVASLAVSIGQVLEGSEDIVTVAQVDKLWVDLRVYERDLARIAPGRPVEVRVLAYPDRAFPGALAFVGDVIDPVTRTVPARASVAGAGLLRPGMTATALVSLRTAPGSLWLPAEAVQRHEGAPIVFVRAGERRFTPVRIAVGPEEGGFVPVRGGLAQGAEVVVHGALALRGELERAAIED